MDLGLILKKVFEVDYLMIREGESSVNPCLKSNQHWIHLFGMDVGLLFGGPVGVA
jgi:hypothetical protein